MWCAVLWYALLCCAVMWSDVLWCARLWYDVLWCDVICCDVICCAMMRCAMLWYDMLCCALLCYAVIWYTVLWCAMLWCAVLCCAVLCCAVLCYVLFCYIEFLIPEKWSVLSFSKVCVFVNKHSYQIKLIDCHSYCIDLFSTSSYASLYYVYLWAEVLDAGDCLFFSLSISSANLISVVPDPSPTFVQWCSFFLLQLHFIYLSPILSILLFVFPFSYCIVCYCYSRMLSWFLTFATLLHDPLFHFFSQTVLMLFWKLAVLSTMKPRRGWGSISTPVEGAWTPGRHTEPSEEEILKLMPCSERRACSLLDFWTCQFDQ